MENAERLVSKAYEWVDQAAHELQWDDGYTATRKGERERGREEREAERQQYIIISDHMSIIDRHTRLLQQSLITVPFIPDVFSEVGWCC